MADLIEGRAVDQRHGIGVAEDGLPWSPLGVRGEEQHIITDLECEDQAGVVDRVVQAGDRGEQILFAGVADVDDPASGGLRQCFCEDGVRQRGVTGGQVPSRGSAGEP